MSVKNISNLEESFEDLQGFDLLDGLECERCGKMNTTYRRSLFKKLPNVMIIQLKRFEFNQYGQAKINQKFDFPLELDMQKHILIEKKYPRSYYQYELCGVVIHSGTLVNGHYWTWIKHDEQ